MKDLLAITVAVVVIGFIGMVGTIETHYAMNGVVIENGIVELENGQRYEFKDDSIKVGDKLNVYMDNSGTDTILHDDRIVRYRKIVG